MATTYRTLRVLAGAQCPLAATHGYQPEHPLGDVAAGQAVLDAWPDYTLEMNRITPDRGKTMQWMATTAFGMDSPRRAAPPPARADDSYWLDREAVTRVELPSGLAEARAELPFLHKNNTVWEAVYVDGRPRPMKVDRRRDFLTIYKYHAAVFKKVTGQRLFGRLLAPSYRHEETVSMPNVSLVNILLPIDLGNAFPNWRPGKHCFAKEDRDYRCPLRSKGACEPFGS